MENTSRCTGDASLLGNHILRCSRPWRPASLYRVPAWTPSAGMAQAGFPTALRSHLLPAGVPEGEAAGSKRVRIR